MTLSGSVCRKAASWWQITSPPIRGCLKMYIDWSSSGSAMPRVADQPGERRSAREPLEDRIEVVERMADLVDRALLALPEPAALVERLGLEEEADLIAGLEKIAVLGVVLPRGREDRGHLAGLERLDQLGRPRAQRRAFGVRHEPGQDQIAVALKPMAGPDHACLRRELTLS